MFGIKLSPTVGLIVTVLVAGAAGVLAAGLDLSDTVRGVLVFIIAAGGTLGIRVAKPGGDA